MSITHNKNLNTLLNLVINCISARFAPQVLSIKGECTFLLTNFLYLICVIDLLVINFLEIDSLLEIFSFLAADFLQA